MAFNSGSTVRRRGLNGILSREPKTPRNLSCLIQRQDATIAEREIAKKGARMNAAEEPTTLTGIWRHGQVILDSPADWPEGCRVVVIRDFVPYFVGTTGDEQADDPESIARWLAKFDAIPRLEMTPEEEAEWTPLGRHRTHSRSPTLRSERGESRP